VSDSKKVTLNETNKSVSSLLTEVLSERDLSFDLIDRVIVITPSVEQQKKVSGTVSDAATNEPLIGVTINVQGTSKRTVTDVNGKFSIDASKSDAVLILSYIGYVSQNIPVNGQSNIEVKMVTDVQNLNEVVVVGYGVQRKESITGSIAAITAKDIAVVHGGSTVSSGLAGKIAGVTFRMAEGRPGASATVQIRSLGTPLYVIDGIQKDEGQFNNISPNDIDNITVLKDASAAIYGVKAANGVVVVTTKHGSLNTKNTVQFNALYGFQNWTRFPEVSNAYAWQLGKLYADVNQTGRSAITQSELDKWKTGTAPGYQSFDWYKAIVTPNMPQSSYNLNASGGNADINYYVSLTRYDQDAVIKEYSFNRTNFQSNVDANITKNLKVGVSINGRIEERVNPGVPQADDYWVPRFGILRNLPMWQEYANGNPLYMNNIGDNSTNFALMNFATSGKYQDDWRVLQTNFNAAYKFPIKGLSAKASVSYYFADELMNNHEYTYKAYTYDPNTKVYNWTGGSQNPWQERQTRKVLETVIQGQLNYTNSFGKHNFDVTLVSERSNREEQAVWVHVVPPLNPLNLMQVSTLTDYNDSKTVLARVGYVGRLNYNYANKYYFEFSGRRDASSMFAPDKRWGNFFSSSAGWRITGEDFYKKLTSLNSVLTDFKFRGSYGQLGDDSNIGLNPGSFTYIPGYSYPSGGAVLGGQFVVGASDRGLQATNLSWSISKILDLGADFTMFNGKITGAVDFFNRNRTGLANPKNDVILPYEVGFVLPNSNVGSDQQIGGDFNLAYNTKINDIDISVGANWGISRRKLQYMNYNPQYGNSWDYYRNSTINRWNGIWWGYECVGQFQTQDQINSYKINNDGKGNKTQLPGDLIYKDQNGDGLINQLDQRPIGYPTGNPIQNFGFNFTVAWKSIDFRADFSGGVGYTYERNYEMMWPFQNGGNLLSEFANSSWHRANPFDVNSAWIAGTYPAITYNNGSAGNDYGGAGAQSSFWLTPVKYFRARTIELGYTLPKTILNKMKIQKLRVYINTYNLFSFDNMAKYGIETEVADNNGLQYPQSRIVNLGLNLSF
jgi:TonB-linked SusC/RagA family outer membrane protein